MSSFLTEEISHRLNWLRDDQSRTNLAVETRLRELEAENKDIRNRLMVLTRLLIARQIATAEEIAAALTAASTPPVETTEEASAPEPEAEAT